ncbi:hypothetical protein A2223_00890 [Candidatus Falkowbacteria bacterium RIFOXYA2_FULL_35_8]|nr:MAG: hypothetical protein A2223_00890 [Candidatus Falkowbacteria bacterium RIFOXYA2_FULL_35_8]
MNTVFVINPPEKHLDDLHITKDMAGGVGFNAGNGIVLPPLELIYHCLRLKELNFKVNFFDLQANANFVPRFWDQIMQEDNPIILILITTPTLNADLKFIKEIKDTNPKSRVFVKFSLKNEKTIQEILETKLVEKVLLGETELIIGEIINNQSTDGCVWLENNNLTWGNELKIMDLNRLPDFDLHWLDFSSYQYVLLDKSKKFFFTFQSSRGCPFPCSYYCPYPLLQGKIWRAMSQEKLFSNVKKLYEQNVGSIFFRDATFTVDGERIKKFCNNLINNRIKINWWCETRMNCLDEKLLKKMAEAGCKGINLGVETGDDELMKKQGKVGGDIIQLKKIIDLAKTYKIQLHFLMIVGLPEETKSSLYKSFDLIYKTTPKSLGVTTITPYPGTELYTEAIANNWIEDDNTQNYNGNQAVMRSKHLTANQIRHGNFMLKVVGYLGRHNSPIHYIMKRGIRIYFWLWSKI